MTLKLILIHKHPHLYRQLEKMEIRTIFFLLYCKRSSMIHSKVHARKFVENNQHWVSIHARKTLLPSVSLLLDSSTRTNKLYTPEPTPSTTHPLPLQRCGPHVTLAQTELIKFALGWTRINVNKLLCTWFGPQCPVRYTVWDIANYVGELLLVWR